MRTMFERPVASDRFDGLLPRREGVLDVLEMQVAEAVSTLAKGPGRVFVPDDFSADSEAGIELAKFFRRALDLYVQVQTQFIQFKWCNPMSTPIGDSVYDGRLMKKHFLQQNKDLTGMPIRLVVRPAVSFSGNEDGEKYDLEKTVLKTTVWAAFDLDDSEITAVDAGDPMDLE
jgi:hypothetical protein